MSRYLIDRILEKICDKIDISERKTIKDMRERGKLLFLSELIPCFKGAKLFMFGTGGSVDNLKDVSRLKNYNLLTVSLGPLYMYRKYKFIPNIWYLHYWKSAKVILEEEKITPLDFSDTFILVPANDSQSAVYFNSAIMKEFRRKHPEATYVLYREIRKSQSPENISINYMCQGIEPFHLLGGGNIENCFLPIGGYLGISKIYFSGVDHLPTGHFWDRARLYQTMDGELIDFPDKELTLKTSSVAQAIANRRGIKIYRLEPEETIFMNYPYLDFEKAFAEASPRITPNMLKG